MSGPGESGRTGTRSGDGWIDHVRPPVPAAFRPWLETDGESAVEGDGPDRPDIEALVSEAEAALERSLEAKDDPREGAFDLLAADAFLTWAAEAALEADDPTAVLDGLVRRLAAGAPDRHAPEGR